MEIISFFILSLGLLLSVKTILYQTGHQKANRFLGTFLFCTAILFFLNFHFFYCNNFDVVLISIFGFNHFYLLIGPFAFFYIRGTLRDDARLKPHDFLHFITFFVIFAGQIPFFLSPWETKLEVARLLYDRKWEEFLSLRLNVLMPYVYSDSLRVLSILCYGIAQWGLIWKYKGSLDLHVGNYKHSSLVRKWLLIFSGFYSVIVIQRFVIGGLILFRPMTEALIEATAITCLSMSVLFVGMNFGIFIFNELFYGIMVEPVDYVGGKVALSEIGMSGSFSMQEKEDSQNQFRGLFHLGYIERIELQLEEWVQEKKYLEKVTLQDLSEVTGIPSHHLSYYFNSIMKIKFPDWRNQHRITYAKELLEGGLLSTLNLEGVAGKCGFSSRATFFRVFKDVTGVTPLDYLRSKI